jgi:hypothetical protein
MSDFIQKQVGRKKKLSPLKLLQKINQSLKKLGCVSFESKNYKKKIGSLSHGT